MQTYSSRIRAALGAAALSAILAAGAPAALAQGRASDLMLFNGDTMQQAGITLGDWGNGEAMPSKDNAFTGGQSIKVTTHGPYQGARIEFQRPVDLKTAATDNTAYLQIVFMQPDKNATGFGGPGGFPGGDLGPGVGRPGASGRPGGAGGIGAPGGAGEGGYPGGGQNAQFAKPKPLANLRIVLVTADGKQLALSEPLDGAHTERDQWQSVAVPTSAISGLKTSSGEVKEVRIFGDSPAVLYVGQIRVLHDETPIRVDDLEDITIAKNDQQTFTASADGGPAALKYDWTIQGVKSRDGDPQEVTENYQVVGEGKTFKHRFVKSGDYVVTLTVSDPYGIKKPVTKKGNVHVTL